MTSRPSTSGPGESDAQLVSQSRAGNREAFSRIVARYQDLVVGLAYSGTGSLTQSQDLAQETFLIAWTHLAELHDPEKLRAWLCGIVKNRIRKSHRQLRREPVHHAEPIGSIAASPSPDLPPAELAISREEEVILWRSLDAIPELYREPLILFYRQEQSVQKVAEQLALSEDTVKQRLSRGRKLLRQRVVTIVERALRGTKPPPGFAAGVLALLPPLPASAQAGKLGLAAAKAGLAFWSPFIAVLGASCVGWKARLASAKSARERQFLLRAGGLICLGAGVIWLGLGLGWWAPLWSRVHFFGHDVAQIVLFYGLACALVAQQDYLLRSQHRIQVEDGTSNEPDPGVAAAGLGLWVAMARRLAPLLAGVLFVALQAVSERQWTAAGVGLLLVPLFVFLAARRWRSSQRNKLRTWRRGLMVTVLGFCGLASFRSNRAFFERGSGHWEMQSWTTMAPLTIGIVSIYGVLLFVALARARSVFRMKSTTGC